MLHRQVKPPQRGPGLLPTHVLRPAVSCRFAVARAVDPAGTGKLFCIEWFDRDRLRKGFRRLTRLTGECSGRHQWKRARSSTSPSRSSAGAGAIVTPNGRAS